MSRRLFWLRLALVSIIGMIVFVSLLSAFRFTIGAFEIELALRIFDHGLTEVVIPPVGLVRAPTHLPPFMFQVTLLNVNLDMLNTMAVEMDSGAEIDWLIREGRSHIYWFVVRSLALSFLGGAAGAFLLYRRPVKHMLWGGLIGFLVFALLLFGAGITYDIDAFANPEFEGLLNTAPWLIGLVEETIVAVNTLGEQLQIITSNLLILFEQVGNLQPLGVVDGDLKVLHVSDIHNNPAAYDFIYQVIRTFDIDLVIDTGDITDYGTPLEAELTARIANFPAPYILIPGNHDSPQVIEFLQDQGIEVLLEGVVEIEGVRIAGIQDPSSQSTAMAVQEEAVYRQYIRRLEEVIDEADGDPHIIAAHHPKITDAFRNKAPVLLQGHTHRPSIEIEEGYVSINAGTTGAAGVRGLQAEAEIPHSLVLLHFDLDDRNDPVPVAADFIRVFHIQSSFSLDRHIIRPPLDLEPEDIEDEVIGG